MCSFAVDTCISFHLIFHYLTAIHTIAELNLILNLPPTGFGVFSLRLNSTGEEKNELPVAIIS